MDKEQNNDLEIWMQGEISSIPALLQPVAHTLLQVSHDIQKIKNDEIEPYLWIKPFDMASIGFHLQHIAGVIDRMFSYSKGNKLTEEQFEYLKTEGKNNSELKVKDLKRVLNLVIQDSVDHLKTINPNTLTDQRFLGRKRIPTTQLGLLFHSAEHAQRHYGQLLVTINIIKGLFLNGSIH